MDNREYTRSKNKYAMSLNVKEVAEIIRIRTKLVYLIIKNGTILSVKIGRENRIPKTDLIAYMRGLGTHNMS